MPSTAAKVRIARGLFSILSRVRRLAGLNPSRVQCIRGGIRWDLDLSEGIQLALYLRLYERGTYARLRTLTQAGATVLDIGANIGAHTLPLAQAVGPTGRVVAVEPTEAAFSALSRNIGLNPSLATRIHAVQMALGAPGGALEASYYARWGLTHEEGRHPVLMGTRHDAASARFSTVDALVRETGLSSVGLIKMDVDGREVRVLRGAAHVLGTWRPTVVFEACPYLLEEFGASLAELLQSFEPYGYEILDEDTMRPVGSAEALGRSIPAGGSRNLVARPSAAHG